MSVTKTARTLQASASNAAGATATGTALNLTTALGCEGVAKITNGATGPTVGCSFSLQWSNDNSTWFTLFTVTATTTASAVATMPWSVGPEAMYIRSVFTGNTGQAVTVECQASELTSV